MFDFHADRRKYFDMSVSNTETYVIPFIERVFSVTKGMRVLEIGCGEGGVLKAFLDKGCMGIGVDTDPVRVENAAGWLSEEIRKNKLRFVTGDIYQSYDLICDRLEEMGSARTPLFDIIVLKDTIEHIPDQHRLLGYLKKFLLPDGVIFFGFPPWQMPFGGHQQMCRNKWLSVLPYYHLLPRGLYKSILRHYREPVTDLLEIRDTRLSIEHFERIVRKNNYTIVHQLHYLINPIYAWKFGWKPRTQLPVIRKLPYLRNFVTSCVYYLVTV